MPVYRRLCDIEVLVHLFEEDLAAGFLAHLNGQFACALYDQRTERLLLARDHFGIAPVGFYLSGGVDSSLIAALISTASPGILRDSFSIAFQDGEIDERRF